MNKRLKHAEMLDVRIIRPRLCKNNVFTVCKKAETWKPKKEKSN